jgi:HlyD family secretion protein
VYQSSVCLMASRCRSLGLGTLLFLLLGRGLAAEPIAERPTAATGATLSPITLASPSPGRVFELTGDLAPRQNVRVYSRVSGMVKRILVRESSLVKAGDVMAEIDPVEYEIAVAQAKAAVAMAEAKLAGMEAGGRPEERSRAGADVDSAAAVVREARANHDRMSSMFGKGGVSHQSLDAARRDLDVANSKLIAALKSLSLVNEGPRAEDRQMARADLARLREDLKLAELKLSYCKVRAPFSGIVGQRLLDEGTYVLAASSPQAPALFTFADPFTLKALVDVPETDILYLRIGMPATIQVQSMPDELVSGHVANIFPFVDPKTRTSKLEVDVPNPTGRLLPGQFVKAKIHAAATPARSAAEVLGRPCVFDRSDTATHR